MSSKYQGTSEDGSMVLFSAHYDSRGSFGSTRAPGGDDDGSGTTSILSIARAIGKSGINFKSDVELCLFAGEEQGLLGSKAYARKVSSLGRLRERLSMDIRHRRAESAERQPHAHDSSGHAGIPQARRTSATWPSGLVSLTHT